MEIRQIRPIKGLRAQYPTRGGNGHHADIPARWTNVEWPGPMAHWLRLEQEGAIESRAKPKGKAPGKKT